MKPSKPSNYIPTLDGWRAVSIIAVIGFHAGWGDNWWLSPFTYGFMGVSIFFGISGYLICSRLLDEEERHGKISLKGFYIRRVCRIVPPAFLYILVISVLGLAGLMARPSKTETLASLFFFRNYIPDDWSTSYTGHYWSLAVEEHFYLLWPALLLLLGSKRALKLAPFIAIAIPIWRFIDVHLHIVNIPGSLYYQRTDWVLDGLLWGCVLALVMRERNRVLMIARLTRLPIWLFLLAVFCVLCVYPVPLRAAFEAMIIPVLLIGTVLHRDWLISRLLESRTLVWIGRLSYSLYIWQSVLFIGPQNVRSGLQVFPVNVIALLAIAFASYYVIEKPLIRLGQQFAQRIVAKSRERPLVQDPPLQVANSLSLPDMR